MCPQGEFPRWSQDSASSVKPLRLACFPALSVAEGHAADDVVPVEPAMPGRRGDVAHGDRQHAVGELLVHVLGQLLERLPTRAARWYPSLVIDTVLWPGRLSHRSKTGQAREPA